MIEEGDTVLFEDGRGDLRTGTVTARKGNSFDVRSSGSVWLLGRDALTLVPREEPGRWMGFAGTEGRVQAVQSAQQRRDAVAYFEQTVRP